MADINCTGCGGVHPRPGGSRCKNLKFGIQYWKDSVASENESEGQEDLGVSDPNSKVAWDTILSPTELSTMPARTEDSYLPFCGKIIQDLNEKVEQMSSHARISEAEDKITELMQKLHLGSSRQRRRSCPPMGGHQLSAMGGQQVPATTLRSSRPGSQMVVGSQQPYDVSASRQGNGTQAFELGFPRNVVEPGDTKEYIGKLRPENHLVPQKTYENMNFRELVLGMDGVHSHLISNNRCVSGYEAHSHFVKRKSVNFLYSNIARSYTIAMSQIGWCQGNTLISPVLALTHP